MLQLPATFHSRREVHYVAVHGASQELDPLATSGHGPEHIKVNLTDSDATIDSCKLDQGKWKHLHKILPKSYSVFINTFKKYTHDPFLSRLKKKNLKFVLDQFFGICGIEKPRFIFFFTKTASVTICACAVA